MPTCAVRQLCKLHEDKESGVRWLFPWCVCVGRLLRTAPFVPAARLTGVFPHASSVCRLMCLWPSHGIAASSQALPPEGAT
jgi:hypothetical protein